MSENYDSDSDALRLSYIEVMIDANKVVALVDGINRKFTIPSSKGDKISQMPEEYSIDSAVITGAIAVPDEVLAREESLSGKSVKSALFDDEGAPRPFKFIEGTVVGKQDPDRGYKKCAAIEVTPNPEGDGQEVLFIGMEFL